MSDENNTSHASLMLLLGLGWACLVASSICLYFMSQKILGGAESSETMTLLIAARMCGIGGFVIGVVGIINGRWTAGALLLLLSLVLPIVSVFVAGSM